MNAPLPEPANAITVPGHDLRALAWVSDELRRSLDTAHKALRRHLKEAADFRDSDLDVVDPAVLRQARAQLHQAVGALELIGEPIAAQVLRASEAAVQRLCNKPALVTAEAVETIEHASFALLDYLARLLAGKPVSTVALYPPYRAAQELAAADRIHPADLWNQPWRWRELPADPTAPVRSLDTDAREEMEALLLPLMRAPDRTTLGRMSDLCAGIGASQTGRSATLWRLAAAFYQAQGAALLRPDVYTKRIAPRLLAQARAGADPADVSERLAADLLFFCARAEHPRPERPAQRLVMVRSTYEVEAQRPPSYETTRLGRFDPAWIVQARKRVAVARDGWSAVAGADLHRLPGLGEAFALVGESLQKLYPNGERLAQALMGAVGQTAQSQAAPPAPLAMEVATSVLYLEASLEDVELDHPELASRIRHLADRVDAVRGGAEPSPLEPWMEELYRRVSDRQTMGSVVQELRATLSEVEKQIDQFFRAPTQREVLIPVPSQLSAMRGVLSVLGLDQASQAVVHLRDEVDALAQTEVDPERAAQAGTFDRLAENLGALSFLIDMLAVQPQMAKSLFRFDAGTGALRAVMGRSPRLPGASGFGELDLALPAADDLSDRTQRVAAAAADAAVPDDVVQGDLARLAQQALLADERALAETMKSAQVALASTQDDTERRALREEIAQTMAGLNAALPPAPSPAPLPSALGADDEMREVFLEEAREVIGNAIDALDRLSDPSSASAGDPLEDLTTLRRAFHTLKGSGRMVGLAEFGEAAWSAEQLYNARLAEAPRLDASLHLFTSQALAYLGAWIESIAAGRGGGHQTAPVRAAADALRLEGRSIAIAPAEVATAEVAPAVESADLVEVVAVAEPAPPLPLDLPELTELSEPAESAAEPPVESSNESNVALTAVESPAESPPQDLPADLPVLTDLAPPEAAAVPLVERIPDLPRAIDLDLAPPAWDETQPIPVLEAVPAPADAGPLLLPDVDFTLDLGGAEIVSPNPVETTAALPIADFPPAVVEHVEIDLGAQTPEPAPPPAPEPEVQPEAEPAAEAAAPFEEQVKVIGDLRIDIAMFNIYLNEADELSRRLSIDLAEWGMEPAGAPGEGPVVLAHSLAGSSATVGFGALSQLARALEHALMRHNEAGDVMAGEAALYGEAADEIRRLLHQFAAGFLKAPDGDLIERLDDHRQTLPLESSPMPLPAPAAEPADGAMAEGAAGPLIKAAVEPAFGPVVEAVIEVPAPAEPEVPADVPLPLPMAEPPLSFGEQSIVLPGATAFAEFDPEAPQTPVLRPALARADAFDDEDDIDAEDQIDPELFPIFSDEASELIPQLQARIHDWLRRPADQSAAAACMRTLHTFKGGARLAGAMRLGEMAHRLETAIEHVLARSEVHAPDIEPLVARVDSIQAGLDALLGKTADALPFDDRGPLTPAAELAPAMTAAEPLALAPVLPAEAPTAGLPEAEAAAWVEPALAIDWQRFVAQPVDAARAAAEPERAGAAGAVRVRAALLDRLVNQAGEVAIARARIEADVDQIRGALGDLTENLERLRNQLRDLEAQSESQMSSRLEAAKAAAQDFDPLEMDRYTRVQELTRMMAESVNDVATVQRGLQRTLQSTEDELAAQSRLTRGLQDDLLRTRMVEFESLSDRLYRAVRQTAKEAGKQVRLDIVGGSIEIDRGVLERMTGPFEHLLRNAIVHGIEGPQARQAAGKDMIGEIRIALQQEGNEVSVEFRDDGAGLDLRRIRERGFALGLLTAGAELDDASLAELIFHPGFSTASSVTELAGRGVGMDVVRSEVVAMGGRIETGTAAGQGTRFRLVLPLTTAVTQVVLLRCGKVVVAVPSTLVEVVRRVPMAELEASYDSGSHALPGAAALAFFWLGALLQESPRGTLAGKSLPVVIIRSAAQRVALHVDEVVGNQEVVVKNLGPQLSRLPGLAGMTLLPSGAVAPIYNPVALAALYGHQAQAWQRQRPAAAAETPEQGAGGAGVTAALPMASAPLVLVVDDSLTVRRVTQRLLQREGYRVVTAKDGLDAIERLSEQRPAIVLSDIEMPRMDGFDLVRNLRADARLADLPVIMITSRIAQRHRDYAAELGVDHYLGKPYSEEELLALVARYARGASAMQ